MLSTMVSSGLRAAARAAMGRMSPSAWNLRFSWSGRQPLQFFRAQVITVWQCPLSTGRLMRKSASSARQQICMGLRGVFTRRVLSCFRS